MLNELPKLLINFPFSIFLRLRLSLLPIYLKTIFVHIFLYTIDTFLLGFPLCILYYCWNPLIALEILASSVFLKSLPRINTFAHVLALCRLSYDISYDPFHSVPLRRHSPIILSVHVKYYPLIICKLRLHILSILLWLFLMTWFITKIWFRDYQVIRLKFPNV